MTMGKGVEQVRDVPAVVVHRQKNPDGLSDKTFEGQF